MMMMTVINCLKIVQIQKRTQKRIEKTESKKKFEFQKLQITDYNGDGGVTTISTKVMNDC